MNRHHWEQLRQALLKEKTPTSTIQNLCLHLLAQEAWKIERLCTVGFPDAVELQSISLQSATSTDTELHTQACIGFEEREQACCSEGSRAHPRTAFFDVIFYCDTELYVCTLIDD